MSKWFVYERLRKYVLAIIVIGHTILGIEPIQAAPVELKHGRYIGWIKLVNRNERIAVVSDFFLESPEDLTKFPRLKSIIKLSLGGYSTHEYLTETYDDLRYDFDQGILTFDEPANDLVMITEVSKVGSKTKLLGDVFIRSSAASGWLELTYEDDEPEDGEDDSPSENETAPFIPLLDGQYEGMCDENEAALQIQTVRGLRTKWQNEKEMSGLAKAYGIVGRVAYRNHQLCGEMGPNQWCSIFDYSAGSYNFYLGKLNLHGPRSADTCDVLGGRLKCRIRVQGTSTDCDFIKNDMSKKEARFFSRTYHLNPTASQKQDLPEPNPPKNTDLTSALKGDFWGYMHNETTNAYQVIRLSVMPYSSTENPHNPNQMMMTSSVVMHLDRGTSGPFVSQRFESRSFYLRPGFTLMGPNSDSYISIQEWKRGYIRGIWYSHAFGRVGTVQLVKGSLPPISDSAFVLPSFAGEFEGPIAPDGMPAKLRWFKFLFPAQPNDLVENVIKFTGSYQPLIGVALTPAS